MKNLLVLILCSVTLSASACDIDGKTGFLPENDLRIPVSHKSKHGITEAVFNQVIDEVEAVYAPIFKKLLKKKLVIKRKWKNETVNASASQTFSWLTKRVIVNMYGGLARHEHVTRDGFAVVLCHEVGHHLAGSPRYPGIFGGTRWAASEGQSDYFATLKCFRKVYADADNESIIAKMDVPETIENKCNEVFKSRKEVALCIRGAMGGKSSATLLTSLRNRSRSRATPPQPVKPLPRANTPDPKVVDKTFMSHPEGQCRMDTYFAGAVCDVSADIDVDMDDPNIGTCNRKDGNTEGLRPLCWYKPAL